MTIFSVLVTIASIILSVILGVIFYNVLPISEVYTIAFWSSFTCLAVLFIVGLVINHNYQKKYRYVDLKKERDILIKKAEYSNQNYSKYLREIKFKLQMMKNYRTLIIALQCIILVSFISILIARDFKVFGEWIIVALVIIVLLSIMSSMFGYKTIDHKDNIATRESFPKLYSLIEEVKSGFNIKANITAYFAFNNNVAISKSGRKHYLMIGIIPYNLLSVGELKSVISHEFAHIYNKDTHTIEKLNNNLLRWEKLIDEKNDLSKLCGVYFKPFALKMSMHSHRFKNASQNYVEIAADNYTKEHASTSDFINASAKLEYFDLFNSSFDLMFKSFRNEDLSKTIIEDCLNEFYDSCEKDYEKYDYVIEKQLTPIVGSHPILRERMQNFSVKKYHISFNTKVEYKDEIESANSMIDEAFFYQNYDEYYLLHKDYRRIETSIVEFELLGDKANLIQTLEYGKNLLAVSRVAEAKHVFESILKKYPKNAPAIYMLGRILILFEKDETGIDLVYDAINKNNRLIEEGLEIIADFIFKYGLEHRKNEYLSRSVYLTEYSINEYQSLSDIKETDNLAAPSLDKYTIDSILADFNGFDTVALVYCFKKIVSNRLEAHIFGFEAVAGTRDIVWNETIHALYQIVDNRNEQIVVVKMTPQIKEVLTNVEGIQIFKLHGINNVDGDSTLKD